MPKGCPNCHMQSWKICPNCGQYTCLGCGRGRSGDKQTACNTCVYCRKTGGGWKTTNKSPSWATYNH